MSDAKTTPSESVFENLIAALSLIAAEHKRTGGDNALGRRALNAVRIVSDSTPTTILTASADSGLVAAIMLEMECVAGDGRRLTAAFFWDDARRFAEALLVIVHDAEERDRERVRQRQEADDAE